MFIRQIFVLKFKKKSLAPLKFKTINFMTYLEPKYIYNICNYNINLYYIHLKGKKKKIRKVMSHAKTYIILLRKNKILHQSFQEDICLNSFLQMHKPIMYFFFLREIQITTLEEAHNFSNNLHIRDYLNIYLKYIIRRKKSV